MIITKIKGGIGNQLFQYAMGRAASLRSGQELFLDTSAFATYWRKFMLDHFNIVHQEYDGSGSPAKFKEKREFEFDPDILEKIQSGDAYLDGYWQNEDYFSEYREELLEDLTLKPEYGVGDSILYQEIQSSESIALHFRRGDYLTHKRYEVLETEYYRQALSGILDRLKNKKVRLFVFAGEDIDWVKANFSSPLPTTFVTDEYGLDDPQEFVVMSACKHQIIANSTFSWWAAWLNKNPDKLICAPHKWFTDGKENTLTSKLIPKNWIRI